MHVWKEPPAFEAVVSHGWHTHRRVWPPSPFPAHPAAEQDPAGPSWTRLTISPLARTLPASVEPIQVDAFLREEQVAAKLSHVQGNGPWATSFFPLALFVVCQHQKY